MLDAGRRFFPPSLVMFSKKPLNTINTKSYLR